VVGILEAFTSAVGEVLNELGGFRFTRLTANVAAGDVTFPVETTFGWPASGKVVASGTIYNYTGKTATTLTGISFVDGATPIVGAKVALDVTQPCIDFSKSFSGIDLAIRSFFVNTANGADLSTLGRNLGVDRPPGLEDDDLFRKVIRALAYTPKGTMFTLEAALTAFFGEDNFQIWENFPTSRNTVFVKILGGLFLATSFAGQTYLTKREKRVLNTATREVTTLSSATQVEGVRLADEDAQHNFQTMKPTAVIETRFLGDVGDVVWTFSGTNESTGALVSAADGGCLRMLDTGAADTAVYVRTTRLRPESEEGYFEVLLRPFDIPSAVATSGRQFAMHLRDGARDLAVGFIFSAGTAVDVGFLDPTTGTFLSGAASIQLDTDLYASVAIKKVGADSVQLLVDNIVAQTLAYASFNATALNEIRFGCHDTTLTGAEVRVKYASFKARTTTDYWNTRGVAGEATALTAFDTGSGALIAGDVGKAMRTFGAPTKKNNGSWVVLTVPSPDDVTLGGTLRQLAILETANPTRVRIAGDARAFKYPDDVGKSLDLTAATQVPNPGSYEIGAILDPLTFTALTGPSESFSNVCEVLLSPGFVTETEIPWRLNPRFSVEAGISWELADTGENANPLLTLRANPPLDVPVGYVVVVEVVYAQVLSGQLVAGLEIVNVETLSGFTYYPFYLPSNPLGPFVSFVDDLTVAGVILEVSL